MQKGETTLVARPIALPYEELVARERIALQVETLDLSWA